jgi:hypothetical protein
MISRLCHRGDDGRKTVSVKFCTCGARDPTRLRVFAFCHLLNHPIGHVSQRENRHGEEQEGAPAKSPAKYPQGPGEDGQRGAAEPSELCSQPLLPCGQDVQATESVAEGLYTTDRN